MANEFRFGRRKNAAGQGGLKFLSGVLWGAGLTYFGNRRRRASMRDQLLSFSKHGAGTMARKSRNLAFRAKGALAELRGRFEGAVDDEILVERVRSQLGHATSHARPIEIHAQEGCVTVGGDLDAAEHDRIVDAIRAVRGVKRVEDRAHVIPPHL